VFVNISVNLPELENGVILVRNRQSEVLALLEVNPAMGSGGALLAPQRGPGRNHYRNDTFQTLHNISEPSFFL